MRSRKARSIRDFISAAAASVKVTTSSSSTSQCGFASQTRCAQRSASTAVLPDPAAAETSKLRPVVLIPAHCGSVHLLAAGLIGGLFAIARPLGLDDLQHRRALHRRQVQVLIDPRIEPADGAEIAPR